MTAQLVDVATLQSSTRRVAILNGFGRTLGDGIIGLQALHLAVRLGVIPPRPTLFRLAGFGPMVAAIHEAADIAEIRILPSAHATPDTRFDVTEDFDELIDIRDFAFAADFQQTSMIDFFLRRLGIEPQFVPSALKRNTWLAPRVGTQPTTGLTDYVLVCPRASMRLRDMPDEIHDNILRQLAGRSAVVTQGGVPPDLAGDVVHAPDCATLAELCALVRNARWVISTDTAMVHLADAFGVPCLAFFPTHRPDWRVRDYPRCVAVALQSGLPPGIEFARSDDDHALARRAWFRDGADLSWLTVTIASCAAWQQPRATASYAVA